jgi:membrane protein implicated in regulation of membrane protease activity
MSLAEIYMYAGAIGFIWIVGTSALGFLAATSDAGADLSGLDGSGGGDAGGGDATAALGNSDAPASGDAGNLEVQLVNDMRTGLGIPHKRLSPGILVLKLISPSTLSTFGLFFGLTGFLLLHWFPSLGVISLLPAAFAGYIGYQLISSFTSNLARKMQVSASYTHDQMIGREAEVTVPLKPNGMGEITYLVSGMRDTAPARAANPSQSFNKGQRVSVSDVRDGIFYIEPLSLEAEWGTTSDTTDNMQKH